MQKRPNRCCPGVRAQLLVGELDLNGLIGAFELNSLAHRLVSRAFAHTWLVFLHKNNQPTNGGLNSTALLRLRGGSISSFGGLEPRRTYGSSVRGASRFLSGALRIGRLPLGRVAADVSRPAPTKPKQLR